MSPPDDRAAQLADSRARVEVYTGENKSFKVCLTIEDKPDTAYMNLLHGLPLLA